MVGKSFCLADLGFTYAPATLKTTSESLMVIILLTGGGLGKFKKIKQQGAALQEAVKRL